VVTGAVVDVVAAEVVVMTFALVVDVVVDLDPDPDPDEQAANRTPVQRATSAAAPARRVGTSSEVFGADGVEELAELADQLFWCRVVLLLALGLDGEEHPFGVHQLVGDEQRLPVRTATATASDGRELTIERLAPASRCSSAKYVEERSSVTTTRSTSMSREANMSRMRSWVIGGGVDALEGVGDRRRLGVPMKMGGPPLPIGLLEQQDRGVGLKINPDRPEPDFDHD